MQSCFINALSLSVSPFLSVSPLFCLLPSTQKKRFGTLYFVCCASSSRHILAFYARLSIFEDLLKPAREVINI